MPAKFTLRIAALSLTVIAISPGHAPVDGRARLEGLFPSPSDGPARAVTRAARQSSEPAAVSPQLRRWILEGREAVWRAWFTNDQAKLEKLIPREAVAINAGEEAWADRAAILEGAKQFARSGAKLVRLEFPRTEIQMYGNTVILYTQYVFETESAGKRSTHAGRGAEHFVIRDGLLVNTGWLLDEAK